MQEVLLLFGPPPQATPEVGGWSGDDEFVFVKYRCAFLYDQFQHLGCNHQRARVIAQASLSYGFSHRYVKLAFTQHSTKISPSGVHFPQQRLRKLRFFL
jgi:hypothetical protein